jgi:transposase
VRGWNTKIHALTTGDAALVKFSLSAGNASGAKEGLLLKSVGEQKGALLLMGRAYEDSKTRAFAEKVGFAPAVPPKRSRKEPRDCGRELYRQRSGAERSSAACVPVATSSTLCSARSFIWLVSALLCAARTLPR